MKKDQTTISVPLTLSKKLKKIQERRHRALWDVIEMLYEEHIKNEK